MIKTDGQSRLFCTHSIPSDLACPQCEKQEKDYQNRPLYASLTASNSRLHQSPARSFNTFYVPMTDKVNRARTFINDDCVNIESNQGVMRVPRSKVEACDEGNVQARTTFPGDFQNHAHRFTRSFSWKTKPEESPFAQMQPLPKLVKKPGYGEICFKNICWPTHQLCLCCGRNTAESCRKWSKSTGEYDYIDACWSSCALCSDDALRIFNTPVVYHEKIIDPELLLPLDAELLYYSIQSAKRQNRNASSSAALPVEEAKPVVLPFTEPVKTVEETPAPPPVVLPKSPPKSPKKKKKKPRSSRKKKKGKSRKARSRSKSKSKRKSRSKSKRRGRSKSKTRGRSKSRKRSKSRSKSRKRSKSRSKSRKRSKSRSKSKKRSKSKSKSKRRGRSKSRKRSKSKSKK